MALDCLLLLAEVAHGVDDGSKPQQPRAQRKHHLKRERGEEDHSGFEFVRFAPPPARKQRRSPHSTAWLCCDIQAQQQPAQRPAMSQASSVQTELSLGQWSPASRHEAGALDDDADSSSACSSPSHSTDTEAAGHTEQQLLRCDSDPEILSHTCGPASFSFPALHAPAQNVPAVPWR